MRLLWEFGGGGSLTGTELPQGPATPPPSVPSEELKPRLGEAAALLCLSGAVHSGQDLETSSVSTDERVGSKMGCVRTMEYYSAFTKKDVLTHAMARMNLADSTLSETSQSRDKYFIFPRTTHTRRGEG